MFAPASKLFRLKRGTTVAEAFCRRVRSEELLLSEGELRDLLRAHPELVQQALSAGDMWDGEEWHYAGSEVWVRGIGKVDLLFIYIGTEGRGKEHARKAGGTGTR
jgi:hypothetical protein